MKERIVTVYMAIFILLLFPFNVFAVDILVSTPVTAATINTAIASASPGDVVCIPDGTYNSLGEIEIPSNVDGTEANPITLQPVTVGGVTFSGDPADYQVIDCDADWWIIQNFKFINISESGSANTHGIHVDGNNVRVTNNYFSGFGKDTDITKNDWPVWYGKDVQIDGGRIDYNTFTGNTALCIVLYDAYNIQIDHNYFNESSGLDSDACSTMQIGKGGSPASEALDLGTIVEYNLIENWTGDIEGISNKSSSNTYRFNVFKTSGGKSGYGLVLRGGDDCIIDSNYFFDVSKYNIRVHGAGHKIINNYFENPGYGAILLAEGSTNYADVSDILIANNTIYGTPSKGIYIGWWSIPGTEPANLTFKNNLIESSTGTLVYDRGHTGTFIWTNNLHYATGSATYWRYSDGGVVEPGFGITKADPNLQQGLYIQRLQESSTNAINKGTRVINVTTDIDGDLRDTSPDIGADEFVSSGINRTPISEFEAGVSWLRRMDLNPPANLTIRVE